jgi:hypothetical protein
MPKSHDEARENRILDEVIVDTYDEGEELMSWYYYFADNMEFPFQATARLALRGGKSEEKKVQIVEVDKRSEEERPIKLGIVESGSQRVQFISPEDIVSAKTSEENLQILNDWLYWHDHNLLPE